jgi:hypothetical protein
MRWTEHVACTNVDEKGFWSEELKGKGHLDLEETGCEAVD